MGVAGLVVADPPTVATVTGAHVAGPTGLDLSLTATGIAYADTGVCVTVGQTGLTDPTRDLAQRAQALSDLFWSIAFDHLRTPEILAIEGLDTSQRYGGVNERAHLWWRIVTRCAARNVPIVEVQSQRLKVYATGNARATKQEVIEAVRQYWPQMQIERDSGHGYDNNKADAAVLAAIGADLLGRPIGAVPETHRKILPRLRITDPVWRNTTNAPR